MDGSVMIQFNSPTVASCWSLLLISSTLAASQHERVTFTYISQIIIMNDIHGKHGMQGEERNMHRFMKHVKRKQMAYRKQRVCKIDYNMKGKPIDTIIKTNWEVWSLLGNWLTHGLCGKSGCSQNMAFKLMKLTTVKTSSCAANLPILVEQYLSHLLISLTTTYT